MSVTSADDSTESNLVSWASVINLLFVASVKLVVVNVGVAPLTTDWFKALTSVIDVNSLSINAPAAVTFAVSVTSALDSTESNFVSWASVINLLSEASVKLVVVNVGVAPLTTDWSNALTSAIEVNSESIKAPAAVTLVASVTSALASIAFNFEWSASVNTFESVAASTAALISASVWSAVALASIAFSLEWSASVNVFESVPASTKATAWAEEDTIPSPMAKLILLSDTVVVIELSPSNVKVSPVV